MTESTNEANFADIRTIANLALASLPASPGVQITSALIGIQSVIDILSAKIPISISKDLSAISLNGIPLIFLGSNYWWIHRFSPSEICNQKADKTAQIYSSLAPRCPNATIFHIVIPEKDTLCLELYYHEYFADYLAIKESSSHFMDAYARNTGSCPISLGIDLLTSCSGLDFSYNDSHLPTELYLLFADKVVKELGGPADWMAALLPLKRTHKWLDLGQKLNIDYSGEQVLTLDLHESVGSTDSESNILRSPLRDTIVSSINSNPILNKKALVLGDSHSSIIGASNLTDIFSSIFREVDFAWNPYCIHGFPSCYCPDDYEVVILETSERFIYGIP
jgi:hypothetical protein